MPRRRDPPTALGAGFLFAMVLYWKYIKHFTDDGSEVHIWIFGILLLIGALTWLALARVK